MTLARPSAAAPADHARPTQLRSTPDGRLIAIVGIERITVQLRQCFPWSEPRRFLSLRDADENEVALIDDIATLDPESRQAIERSLATAAFVLDITRVLSIEEEVEIRHWTVDTRSGRRSFQTRLDDWPLVLPDGALLIRDVGSDLYRCRQPSMLDGHSRSLLWSFVD